MLHPWPLLIALLKQAPRCLKETGIHGVATKNDRHLWEVDTGEYTVMCKGCWCCFFFFVVVFGGLGGA